MKKSNWLVHKWFSERERETGEKGLGRKLVVLSGKRYGIILWEREE